MADIGTALTTYLLSKAAIKAIVVDRISPDPIDQKTKLPAISYFVIDSVSNEDLDGAVGVAHTRIQIDCYAETRIAANALAEAVKTAPLQGYRGLMGSVFVNGVSAGSGARDEHDKPTDGSNRHRYMRSRDYIISHEE